MASGAAPTPWGTAVAFSVLAAFGWATYYLFILKVGAGATPSAALVYPFLFGGGAYALWARAHGEGRSVLALFRRRGAWTRTGLLVGMQLSVLASTYLTGPIDASLLALLGDVVATPLLVALWVGGRRGLLTSRPFVLGLALSLAGGSLAIAGGRSLETVPALGWIAVPAVPLTVAFYFVLSARAGDREGRLAVVAQSMVSAGLVAVAVSPLLPGGAPGLVAIGAVPLFLLAVNGVVSFFLAPLLYFRAITMVGFVVPPMLMTGIPVFTLLLSALFLGEAPTLVALLGIPVAVVGGVVTLESERRTAARTATPTP